MNKIKKIQVFRYIVQILSLFLLPGIYSIVFSDFKDIVSMIASNSFDFNQALPGMLELGAVIFFTALLGRFFCGWICSFGAFNDWIHLLSKKVFKVNFRIDEKVDSVLKYFKYVVLLFIVLISCIVGSSILSGTSPWDAFAQITDFTNVIANITIGFILLILITIGAFFVERFFCRYLCPLGAILSLVSRFGIIKIKKPTEKCGKCRLCTNNCSMGLELYKKEKIKGGECINCLECISTCPRKNTSLNAIGEDINPAFASSVAIATFAGLYGISSYGGNIINQNNQTTVESLVISGTNSTTQKYVDGTYTGTGTGFRGGTTKVSVTISGGRISAIKTVSMQDTPSYYNRVSSTIINKIISSQSTDVDTISGATYSCVGIMDAVQDALDKAANTSASITNSITNAEATITPTTTPTSTPTATSSSMPTANTTTSTPNAAASSSTSQASGTTAASNNSNITANANTPKITPTTTATPVPSATAAPAQQSGYKDGTYTGSGTGFRGGTTKVSVTVNGGKITSIKTVSMQDTPSYYNRVSSTIMNKIISTQSTTVDTISGATYSCKGIITAVKNALSNAV